MITSAEALEVVAFHVCHSKPQDSEIRFVAVDPSRPERHGRPRRKIRTCSSCGNSESPSWRRDRNGEILCNKLSEALRVVDDHELTSSNRCGLRERRTRKTRSFSTVVGSPVDNGKTLSLPERNVPGSELLPFPAVRQAIDRERSAVGGNRHETGPSDIDAVCNLPRLAYASLMIPQSGNIPGSTRSHCRLVI
jgi:hypothetical protein